MLTKERVIGTAWSYRRAQDGLDYHARFEVLTVDDQQKLGIFVYRRDKKLDMGELNDLNLDGLEDLIQRGRIKELVESDVDDLRYTENRELSQLTYYGALILAAFFGVPTFFAGVHGQHQKPWEAGIGAAFMIAGLWAVAIRRV